jgi:hypothetical protein
MLLILKGMLDGHQAIFNKMKATSVSLEKTVVNASREIKVWVNHHLERNDISGEVLTNEKDIVIKIFETVCFFANQHGNLFH